MKPFETLITEAGVEPSNYYNMSTHGPLLSPLGILVFTVEFGRQQVIERLLWHLLARLDADSGDIFRTLNTFAPNNTPVWNLAMCHFRPPASTQSFPTPTHAPVTVGTILNSEVSYGKHSDGNKFLLYKKKRYTTIPNGFPEASKRALRRRAKLSPSMRVRIKDVASLTGPQKKNIHTFFGSNGSSVYYQSQALREV
jgi:hypothetical protein